LEKNKTQPHIDPRDTDIARKIPTLMGSYCLSLAIAAIMCVYLTYATVQSIGRNVCQMWTMRTVASELNKCKDQLKRFV